MAKIYPGLGRKNELDRLSILYGFAGDKISVPNDAPVIGGLHDYISRQDRLTLIRWALTVEEYLKQKTGKGLIGGIHGTKEPLTDEKYAQYIINMAEKFPELNSASELDRLSQVYGFSDNPSLNKLGNFGGLHDFIFRKDRNTLIRWALTAEAHDRKLKNVELLGGLQDYIDNLSNSEIANYVLAMADVYSELNSQQNLDALSQTYQIHYEAKKLVFLN